MRKVRKFTRKLIAFAVVLSLVLGGLWFARHRILSEITEWRSSSLVGKAEKALETGSDRDAVQFATAAWQLGPKDLGTLRRLMVHGRKVRLQDLSPITLLVFFHEESLPEDKTDILKWVLEAGDTNFFDQLYPNLEEKTKLDPNVRLLYARKLGMQGRLLDAIEEARGLEKVESVGAEVSLLLATILPRLNGNQVALREASGRIRELLKDENDEIALSAWRLLLHLPVGERDPGPDFEPEVWVAGRKSATAMDRVLARRILVERLPAAEQSAAMAAITGGLLDDPEAVSWIVRWYLETGHGEDLLRLPEAPFLRDNAVFSSRLQVLLEAGKFEEAKSWLKKAPVGFPESVAFSLEAVFSRRAGRDSEALSHWRKVIERAASLQLYGDCLSVLRIAERFGEQKAAAEIVDVIVSFPSNRLPPSEHLEYLEGYFTERTENWLAFWRGLLRSRPGDGFASEEVAFLELNQPELVDGEIAVNRTGDLIKRFPSAQRFRATHAFWLQEEGRNSEAIEVLRSGDINWGDAEPSALVAYIIALYRSGAGGEAAALESRIRWDLLGPIRRTMLTSRLKGQKDADPT